MGKSTRGAKGSKTKEGKGGRTYEMSGAKFERQRWWDGSNYVKKWGDLGGVSKREMGREENGIWEGGKWFD